MRENGSPSTTLDNSRHGAPSVGRSIHDALFSHIRSNTKIFLCGYDWRMQTTEHGASRRRLLRRCRECRSREFVTYPSWSGTCQFYAI